MVVVHYFAHFLQDLAHDGNFHSPRFCCALIGMTGAAFHNIICQIFIALNIQETILTQGGGTLFDFATVPIYSSVGAASVLAALFRAPLTASLLVFEITRDYDILLPLLASAGVASLASDIIENKLDDSNKS